MSSKFVPDVSNHPDFVVKPNPYLSTISIIDHRCEGQFNVWSNDLNSLRFIRSMLWAMTPPSYEFPTISKSWLIDELLPLTACLGMSSINKGGVDVD